MSGRIHFLFSADYELYFGENYVSEREVLIEPTEQLLEACQEEGIAMTLFADVASVWRYRSLGLESDYPSLFEDQLGRAVRQGHDVQLHLHPHWMTSHFDGGHWHVDETRFNLGDVGEGHSREPDFVTAEELILRGRDYLEGLLRPIAPSYQCIAFRAGGYGIQREEKKLIQALMTAGIKLDSSIVPGMVFESNVNAIDFRRIPSKLNYHIGTRHGIAQEDRSGIFEIPLAAYPESLHDTLGHHLGLLKKVGTHSKNKILGMRSEDRPRGRGIQKLNLWKQFTSRLLRRSLFLLELSGAHLDVGRMVRGTTQLIDAHLQEATDLYLSPSCHPKNVFPSTLQGLRKFWKEMGNYYGDRVRSITFQEAARRVDSSGREADGGEIRGPVSCQRKAFKEERNP
jgi:hypothetical protein